MPFQVFTQKKQIIYLYKEFNRNIHSNFTCNNQNVGKCKCPSTVEQISKLLLFHTKEYHSATNRNELVTDTGNNEQQPGLVQVKNKGPRAPFGSPSLMAEHHLGPSSRIIICWLPECIIKKLDWKWSSQDSNLHSASFICQSH